MPTLAAPRPPHTPDIDALIQAARRRQRRRRLIAVCIAAALAVIAVASLLIRLTGSPSTASNKPAPSAPGRTTAAIRLERPSSLLLGPYGSLYIADYQRNQIIQRLPNGTLRIIAGTGRAGFSGDGGLATHARLNFPRGMAMAPDGTLYLADSGNNRVRTIAPNGIISTIVGNGRSGWVRTGTPARAAPLLDPEALTFGPDGRLYIAVPGDNEILRLEPNRTLTEIAGNRKYAGVVGIGGPAIHASPGTPTAIAFDRAGNLYIAGFATKTLEMITPRGIMTLPAGIGRFYPRGGGDMARAPDGSVYAANTLRIVRLTPHGMTTLFDFATRPIGGITGFLPEGLAVAPNGTIYTDTWLGNGYTNATAVIEIPPHAKPRILWKG